MHYTNSSLRFQDNFILTTPVDSSNTIILQKVIHLDRSPKDGDNLGFRLCYSDVCGSGFFINSLEPGFAEQSGFEVGDEVVAINDIPVNNWQMTPDQLLNVVAGQRQQRAGVDIHIQRRMFNPQKLTTGGSGLIQEVCWYDIGDKTLRREHKPKWPSQLRHTRMKMKDSTTGRMGLNIHGGREFSCGIYISKLERGGLAERCGLRAGDQILSINGVSLIDVPFHIACRHMAYDDTLDFVVRYTGQFPIYIEATQKLPTDRKPKDYDFVHNTSPYRPMWKNYPYSNGRVDPIGSCSPGTIHSFEQSDSSSEVLRPKGLYTDTHYIYNPLCSDESSLLSSISSPMQTSDKASEHDEGSKMNRSRSSIEDWSDVAPKPPPRTGKPDLEKLTEIINRRKKTSAKQSVPSIISQKDSISSKVEVETTAIVHQPAAAAAAADDKPKSRRVENENFLKPVEQVKFRSKPPRKHKKTVEINGCNEKPKPESKNEKKVTTKTELQTHKSLIAKPAHIPTEKIEAETETIERELVERLEQSKPKSVTETCPPDIVIEPESVTVTPCSSLPDIVAKTKEVPIPEIAVEHTNCDPEPGQNGEPTDFLQSELTVEWEMLSIRDANDSMCDDDDRLSFISSLSLEYDGDHFLIKSEDESSSLDHRKERMKPLSSSISKADQDIRRREVTDNLTNKSDEVLTHRSNVMAKVRYLEGKQLTNSQSEKVYWKKHRDKATEPVSLSPEKLLEPPEVVCPSVTTTTAAMTASPSPATMPSLQNTTEKGNYTKPKRRPEESRFQNAVVRTMTNLAASKEEDAENNPFQMLQKMASVILTKDEIKSIMQYIAEYMERNDVEQLVSRLLEILNNPEKHLLLNQIRELVSPFDRGRFDSMLSVHGNINFQKPEYRERFSDKVERGRRPSLKEEQSLLARVQCRRKQLDAQIELLENLRKTKPKIYKHKEEDMNLITVYVSKNIRTLGISVTGGADCKKQQALVIEEVHSGGAAAETKRIKPGMSLVSVDDEDIEGSSHKSAVYTIRRAFTDRKKPYMKLVLRKPVDGERWPAS